AARVHEPVAQALAAAVRWRRRRRVEPAERGAGVDVHALAGAEHRARRRRAPPVLPVGDRIAAITEPARERDLRAAPAYGAEELAGGGLHYPEIAHQGAAPAQELFEN